MSSRPRPEEAQALRVRYQGSHGSTITITGTPAQLRSVADELKLSQSFSARRMRAAITAALREREGAC